MRIYDNADNADILLKLNHFQSLNIFSVLKLRAPPFWSLSMGWVPPSGWWDATARAGPDPNPRSARSGHSPGVI